VHLRLTLERLADPSPRARAWLLGVVGVTLVAVTALRFAISDPLIPVTPLYFIVVVAATLAYGVRGGVIGAAAVAVLYLWWSVTGGPDLPGGQIAVRIVAVLLPWLAFAWVVGLFVSVSRERLRGVADVERANAKLERANRELERSNRDLGQFAHAASHDLSAPLRIVSGFAELLERRAGTRLEPDERGYITTIVDAAGRMQQLIDDILAWSTAGAAPLHLEAVDLGAVLADVEALLAAELAETGGTVEHGALPAVRADPRQLRQVLQNLVANALKFHAGDPPRVVVAAEERPDGWLVRVRDNGIGVDPDHAERIFGMFNRLHAMDEYPGTGIGLAVCTTIVERHGGELWHEPTPGGGSTFCFTLRTRVAAGDGAEVPALPAPERATPA
jgi:signal transduction histidine kinase